MGSPFLLKIVRVGKMAHIKTIDTDTSITASPDELISMGKMEEALKILDKDLEAALCEGDAAKAELLTTKQLGAAAKLSDFQLIKKVRVMRLELYIQTGQKMKASDEFNYLKPICNKFEIDEIKNITGYVDQKETVQGKPLLGQVDTYFIVDNVNVKNNGILNSVLRKITLFEEEWGYRPTLVVSEYNAKLKSTIGHHQYHNATRINTNIQIQNIYNYFQKTDVPNLPVIEHPREEKGLYYKEVIENVYTVYKGQRKVRDEYFTHFKDRLETVQHFDENLKIYFTVFYDKNGYLSMERTDNQDDFSRTELYYTTEGKVCIKSEYKFNEKTDKHDLVSVLLFDDNQQVIMEGKKEADLVGVYLNQVAAKTDRICMFVSESGLHNKSMIHVKQKNAIKASIVHSVFLEDSYNLKSKPQFFFKDLVRYQKHFDGITFLTKAEAKDFITIYGNPERIYTVPHFYPLGINKVDFSERDPKKAVIVARFDNIKRIDMAVDIFKLVVDKIPDATLDIYGFGSDLVVQKIKKQIKKHELENNVFMKGSTDSPDKVYSKSMLFMMTSSMEGMPLTLLESISNGCPVFSFDIKYGPADVVKNGKTGCLIPRGNVKAFAKQIISYFEDDDLQRQMSENAYNDAVRFSKEAFLENWYTYMEEICARKFAY